MSCMLQHASFIPKLADYSKRPLKSPTFSMMVGVSMTHMGNPVRP